MRNLILAIMASLIAGVAEAQSLTQAERNVLSDPEYVRAMVRLRGELSRPTPLTGSLRKTPDGRLFICGTAMFGEREMRFISPWGRSGNLAREFSGNGGLDNMFIDYWTTACESSRELGEFDW